MRVFTKIKEWQEFRSSLTDSLGFVPTMGALHEGHLSLVKKSLNENKNTLVSIFVNPTQFNDPKDFEKYPKTLDQDLALLRNLGCQFVLLPENNELYPDEYRYQIEEKELSQVLCGPFRPGHFKGMLTVVMKLLQIAQSTRAYFGEKDFQQYLLIKGMAESFFLKTEIISGETVREDDGLAMSSRNVRLSPGNREKAKKLSSLLMSGKSIQEIKDLLRKDGFEVDYVEEMFDRRIAAAKIGEVRLIDNVKI